MLSSLAMMVAMAEAGYNHTPESKPRKIRIPTNRKDEIKPKGVKEYWFDIFGEFKNEACLEYYFKCFALNDKNAKRKFDAYRKRHRG